MRTLVFTAITLAAFASIAAADPDPTNSITPEYIDLVGLHNGVPDPAGEFTVQVRDAVNAPVPGIEVSIDFSNCPDLAPASQQPYPGLTVDCGTRIVRATTDANGVARFVIVGSVLQLEPASAAGCAVIRAGPGNVVLGQASVPVYDLDGVNGVGANDVSLWFCEWCPLPILCPAQTPRNDYDHDALAIQVDYLELVDRYFDDTSTETGARCDAQPTVKEPLRAESGGLNLAWNSCASAGGTSTATFACNSNSGAVRTLVFSMVAPAGITGLTAFEAEAIVVGGDPNQPLPDWWGLHTGGCRGLSAGSFSASDPPMECETTVGAANAFWRMSYPHVEQYGGRIRFLATYPSGGSELIAGQEYEVMRFTISNSKTTGTAACAGCDQPVSVTFRSIKLIQGAACAEPIAGALPDVLIDSPANSNRVYWQSTFTSVPQAEDDDLRLARAGANPHGELAVEFTIPTPGTVSLALFDVRGRRLATRTTHAAGTQRVTLAKAGDLRPGLYFVRLEQNGRSKRLKATVIP